MLIGYPLAYFIVFRGGKWKLLLLFPVVVPFLITYLVHPGTAIYVGYNGDLQNLNRNLHVGPTYGLHSAKGYINDSRQFFVKVSYLFRF